MRRTASDGLGPVESGQGAFKLGLGKFGHLPQGGKLRPRTKGSGRLNNTPFLLRQAIQSYRDDALNARRDAQLVDGMTEGEITPLPEKDSGFFEAAAHLLDEERNIRRMSDDPGLQLICRRGEPQDVVQHRPARTLVERP